MSEATVFLARRHCHWQFYESKVTPPKISQALAQIVEPGERAQITLKTSWKPNHGTPILWLTITSERILLFSTVRGGHIFRGAFFTEINSVDVQENGRVVRILFWDRNASDLQFGIHSSVSVADVDAFVRLAKERLQVAQKTPQSLNHQQTNALS